MNEKQELKEIVKTVIVVLGFMLLLKSAGGISGTADNKSSKLPLPSSSEGIMSIFWSDSDQELLEKYISKEREWEATHEDDHFLENLGL